MASYVSRLAQYFRDQPLVWIDGVELARVGGCYAYRTRISDCRTLGMVIENKQVRVANGTKRSLYRYVPSVATAPTHPVMGR